MGFERRRVPVAAVVAAVLAMAAGAGGGEEPEQKSYRGTKISPSSTASEQLVRHDTTTKNDSDGCGVTLHEYRYDDGSRRTVTQTVCDDGAITEVERYYDAQGHLAKVSEHEITADGAVLLDEAAADASAKEAAPKLPDVSAEKADRERTREWLDAKFKEWNAEVEAQTATPERQRELGEN